MSNIDFKVLERAIEGDGGEQAPITKRCLRGILAELKAAQAASKASEAFERVVRDRLS
tara:strand:- start:17741 stop:17914 length:174 start_codon:yes stop_codon:yes gene_type:complete